MGWLVEQLRRWSRFHDVAEIHHHSSISNLADDTQVVGDEQIRQAEFSLQFREEGDDARLDGDIESTEGLVQDEEIRLQPECAGDTDALALPD